MTDQEFLTFFTENYDPARDYAWIECKGKAKEDPNEGFRMQLYEFVVARLHRAPLPLIRDLFLEVSKMSARDFCVYKHYEQFATALLQRGRSIYLPEYIKGASACFDTQIASGRLHLSADVIAEILHWLRTELSTAPPEREKVLAFMVRRFETLIPSNPATQ